MCVCVFECVVCVFVCVCERERTREMLDRLESGSLITHVRPASVHTVRQEPKP